MAKLKVLILVLAALCFSQCSVPNTNNGNLRVDNQTSNPPVDYKKLIAGTWKCVGHEIYVTFKDETITVDYSRDGGRKFTVAYKFKDERTLEVGRYPENLIIVRYTDDEIGFRPEGDELRADIDMIYFCRFVRPLK
jgi:hypothetical protein